MSPITSLVNIPPKGMEQENQTLASRGFPYAWKSSEGKYLTLGFPPKIHLSHLRETPSTEISVEQERSSKTAESWESFGMK